MATREIAQRRQALAREQGIATVPRAIGKQLDATSELPVQLEDESLRASGLLPGDRLAICGREQPRTREIVVVRTACEIAVRRVIEIARRRIRLAREDAESARCASLAEMERDAVRLERVMVGALIGRRPVPGDWADRGR